MAALAATRPAMTSPNTTNNPARVTSIVLNTEPKSNERYHSRDVQTFVNSANAMISTATMINVGRMAPRRRPGARTLLNRPSPRHPSPRRPSTFPGPAGGATSTPHDPYESRKGMRQGCGQPRHEIGAAEQLVGLRAQPGDAVLGAAAVDAGHHPALVGGGVRGDGRRGVGIVLGQVALRRGGQERPDGGH